MIINCYYVNYNRCFIISNFRRSTTRVSANKHKINKEFNLDISPIKPLSPYQPFNARFNHI